MNSRHITLACALALTSPGALAGSFDGPFAQAGIGMASSKTNVIFTGWFDADVSDDSFNGQLAAGYSRAFGRFNLAASASYVVGNQAAGMTTQAYDDVQVDTVDLVLKQTWGLSVEPGYYFSDATLGYLKLGYGQSTGTWKFVRPLFQDSYSGDATFAGFSFGAGAKHSFTANLYGYAEVQQANFGKEEIHLTVNGHYFTDSLEPESLTAFVGIGWKF
jgi:opacity protein-like surface antigen